MRNGQRLAEDKKEEVVLFWPEIAGFFTILALWKWIKQEPWLVVPLLVSLLGVFLCETQGSFLHHTYDASTLAQLRNVFLAVGSITLLIVMCRRSLTVWLVLGVPTVGILWWDYVVVAGRSSGGVIFYTLVFGLGALTSLLWPDKKRQTTANE
jgi:hypothetical protein